MTATTTIPEIDPALIALAPETAHLAIEALFDSLSDSDKSTVVNAQRAILTLIGALVRDRDEEHARADQFIDALVKAGQVAGYSVDKKPCGIQTLNEYLEALVRERDEFLIAARRYETVRKLNPREFAELYERNIRTGTPFDDLVDALAVDIL